MESVTDKPNQKNTGNNPNRLLLRAPEVAESLGVSLSLAYRWMQDGTLPVIRVGRSVRVPAGALEKWISRKTQATR